MSIRKFLKQSFTIIGMAWQKNITYRFTVLSYRVGEVIEVLVLILMWTAIYANTGGIVRGFSLNEMISYVLVGSLFSVAVRNFLPGLISFHINEGRLSMFLVKPISYIQFIIINEMGRAFLATTLAVSSQLIIIVFFLDRIFINSSPAYLLIILAMILLAFVIEVLLGILIGCVAFWTDEVDGLLATIERLKRFFSGGYFPLSLLPASLLTVGTFLPFGYSFFVPAMLYLKKISLADGLKGLGIQLAWIILLSIILRFVWKKGLRKYEAVGS